MRRKKGARRRKKSGVKRHLVPTLIFFSHGEGSSPNCDLVTHPTWMIEEGLIQDFNVGLCFLPTYSSCHRVLVFVWAFKKKTRGKGRNEGRLKKDSGQVPALLNALTLSSYHHS